MTAPYSQMQRLNTMALLVASASSADSASSPAIVAHPATTVHHHYHFHAQRHQEPRRRDGKEGEEPPERCRHCNSATLHLDWAAGDRVCTSCGVVDEEHVRDDRPEWREFNEADDLAKNLPSAARSGLVLTDESKYIGGLQPTTLSRTPFGGAYGPSSASSCSNANKKLYRTNRKLDLLMEKRHAESLREARTARDILIRRRRNRRNREEEEAARKEEDVPRECYPEPGDEEEEIRVTTTAEHEHLVLKEEENARRAYEALNAEKWSLDRALLLHGTDEEARNTPCPTASFDPHAPPRDVEEERAQLLSRLDGAQKRASKEVFIAYGMMVFASERLDLPEDTVKESVGLLCRYGAARDGLQVKGVSNRMTPPPAGGEDKAKTKEREEEERRHRDQNKARQMAALGSAIVYLVSRKCGCDRSLVDVCSSFRVDMEHTDTKGTKTKAWQVKPKHLSRAMGEIKESFPDFVRTVSAMGRGGVGEPSTQHAKNGGGGDATSTTTANLAEHTVRRLRLPPAAVSAVRSLAVHCVAEQRTRDGKGIGETKLVSLCASVAYFVCTAGATMQTLASQATGRPAAASSSYTAAAAEKGRRKRRHLTDGWGKETGRRRGKKVKFDDDCMAKVSGRIHTDTTKSSSSAASCAEAKNSAPCDSDAVGNRANPVRGRAEAAPVTPKGEKANPRLPSTKFDWPAGEAAPSKGVTSSVKLEEGEETHLQLQPTKAPQPCGDETHSEGITSCVKLEGGAPFDVLSHAPVEDDVVTEREREMARLWLAWSQEKPWGRGLDAIEKSCGVSRNGVQEHYRKVLHPRRKVLLEILQKPHTAGFVDDTAVSSSSSSSPPSILLSRIAMAAPLMSSVPKARNG